jgi:glycosyl hydrolase family 2
VRLAVRLSRRADAAFALRVALEYENATLAELTLQVNGDRAEVDIPLAGQHNGQDAERLLWSPEHPRLIDAHLELLQADSGPGDADPVDAVDSYFGMRSVGIEDGRFLLNGRPYFVRGVLEQGYWPQSHLAAPSAQAIRAEVELILDLGFNTARLHQKIEDPRLLYWADRLGLLVWGETPSAFEFSPTAIRRMTAEWIAAIDRDLSHPALVTWVPINESWGVQQIAHDERMRRYAAGLAELTRALDPSRLVVTNDGWEHLDSDLVTIHDYEPDGAALAARYVSNEAVERLAHGIGPAGRRILLPNGELRGRPVILTEFGGISFAAAGSPDDAWGYSTATGPDDFERRLRAIIGAANGAAGLAGWVYTQLTDTLQETNGLTDEQRIPKLPLAVIRSIVRCETQTP